MLHVLSGSSVADHAAGVNVASLTQNGTGIGTETAAQQRLGNYPKLIGLDAQDDKAAAMTTEYFRVYGNTWRNTDYAQTLMKGSSIAADVGGHGVFNRNPYQWVPSPIQFGPEEDYNFTAKNSGGVDHQWAVFLSYDPIIPSRGGPVIARQGTLTAADYGVTGLFGTAGTITDLNPGKQYRIWGLGGRGGADVGILRLASPDFAGFSLSSLLFEDSTCMTYFPLDSLIHNGNSTLSVAASGGAATGGIEYLVLLEEIGDIPRGGGTAGSLTSKAGTTARSPMSLGTLKGGTRRNLRPMGGISKLLGF